MRFARAMRRLAVPLAAAALLLAVPAVASASASSATPGTGWIRMAHLSPNTPPMDIYLYAFGNPDARVVLHHVAYGTVSPYQAVAAGDYSVAMRAAGASAASPPVLSASVTIAAGRAYTAAAVGSRASMRLQIIGDDLTTPAGKALVRVIQASLKQPVVTVSWNGKVVAPKLRLASVSSYRAVSPGTESVTVDTGAADARSNVTFAAGAIYTLVVLDGAHGLEIGKLEDGAGSALAPAGGAATGFGGTAPHGPGSPAPWLEVMTAGLLLAVAGGLGLRRSRRGRPLRRGA